MKVRMALQNGHPGQLILHRDAGRFNVVSCGRRWGKTAFGTRRAIDHPTRGLLAKGYVGWFAPKYKYLDEAFRDFLRILPPELVKYQNMADRRIELHTGGVLEGWSTVDIDAGRSRKYHQVFYDEAAKDPHLKEVWQKAVRPTLNDYRGEAWFLSTPRGMDYFHDLHQKGDPTNGKHRKGWKSWLMPTSTNPYILASEIEDARLDLSDPVFRQEYLAEFIADAGDYFKRAWFDEKFYDPDDAAFKDGWKRLRRFLSIDLAITEDDGEGDPDWTVVAPFGVNYRNDLLWLPGTKRIRERDGRSIASAIVDTIVSTEPDFMIVEDGHIWRGVKASVEDEMRRRNRWTTVREITPTKAGNDPSRSAKQARARSFQAMSQWGRVYLADEPFTHDLLLPELLSFPAGKHDDLVDVGAMAANDLAAAGPGAAPPVKTAPPPPRSQRGMGIEIPAAKTTSRGGLRPRSALRR